MLWTDGGRALSGPKLVIPWNSPWQPKNNLALKMLSSMLRKQLKAAAHGRVVNQIPGRRRYDPKMGTRRELKARGKIHLRRPDEAKSMCGSTVNPIAVRDTIDEVTCMHCEKMYANNIEWYNKHIREEVTDGRHSTASTEGSG